MNGYILGSAFAWLCGADRAKHCKTLLDAKDPFIRVAGAVYLCFEDEVEGCTALKRLSDLDGDPGIWAALTLARRGHKDAIPRLFQVFRDLRTPEEREKATGMSSVPHDNLACRVLVLLSNSARCSGVDQPPAVYIRDGKAFQPLTVWWQAHEKDLNLYDVWMPELAKQHID